MIPGVLVCPPWDEGHLQEKSCQKHRSSVRSLEANEASTAGSGSLTATPSYQQGEFYQGNPHPGYWTSTPATCDLVHVCNQKISHLPNQCRAQELSHV